MTRTGAADAAKVSPKPIMNLQNVSDLVSQGELRIPGADEHIDRVRSGLQDGSATHDESTECNSRTSTETIHYVGREGICS